MTTEARPNVAAPIRPESSSQAIQGPANQSWRDFNSLGQQDPKKALAANPTKNPVDPASLGPSKGGE